MTDVPPITGPGALACVTHPLRVRILAALREHGSATATEMARRLNSDSGTTSYHLRVLQRHGFVVDTTDASARVHPRERRWSAHHRLTAYAPARLAESAEGRSALAQLRRRQLEVLVEVVEQFETAERGLAPDWLEAAGIGDVLTWLTPESLAELWRRFYADIDELAAAEDGSQRARMVSIVVAGFPRTGS